MGRKHLSSAPLVVLMAIVFAFAACGDDAPPTSELDAGPDGPTGPVRADFGLDQRPPNTTCKAPPRPPSSAPVQFSRTPLKTLPNTPMMIAQRPGDPSRWYVAQRFGGITWFSATSPDVTGIAGDLSTLAQAAYGPTFALSQVGEAGLLGFAFHPDFAQNGRLFVSWNALPGVFGSCCRSVLGYLTSTDGGETFGSYTNVLVFDQPAAQNHKGGGIAFGKDGYLYASFGDGGGGADVYVNGQKKTGFLSKVLRIDVNVPTGYAIPDGNPFKNGGGEPATFAYGFRNPFRLSIDRESGDLWVGDVGQDGWEEINAVRAGGNYGWPCLEGTHDYARTDVDKCPDPAASFAAPVVEHQHEVWSSITGGVVYRGKAIPGFVGSYVYGDYVGQQIFALGFDPVTAAPVTSQINVDGPNGSWVSFAEDVDGETYALSTGGQIHKMEAAPGGTLSSFPDRLSSTGCVDPSDATKPAAGLVPYGVNAPLWSDGAGKERFLALPEGATISVGDDGDFAFPIGTVLVKTFLLEGRRVETRLFVHHDDGAWGGYTYEWLDDQTDAVLLPSSKRKTIAGSSWYFPSRSDCMRCHTQAAGSSLGLELGQLNGDFIYETTNRISNQLRTLEHIGLFTAPLGAPVEQLPVLPNPTGNAALDQRARSYLHANCAQCHRPQGGGGGSMDLRFQRTFAETATCNVDPERGALGVAGAKLVVPGDPGKSILAIRAHARGADRMPPLATSLVDPDGVAVIDGWIGGLIGCP